MFWLGLVIGFIIGGALGWAGTYVWFKRAKISSKMKEGVDKTL